MSTATAAPLEVDVAVLGAGMAGMCAALFASSQPLRIAQIGGAGELPYAAGPWDLLAVHPTAERKRWQDPWEALATLAREVPDHPYARVDKDEIRAGFDELLSAFAEAGLPYERVAGHNSDIVTSVGTDKSTYCLPRTMWNGVRARRERLPCLLVDVRGMRDFSAVQIQETIGDAWPQLRACRVELPGLGPSGELSTEFLARSLDLPEWRAKLAESIRPHLGDAQCVGVPAILGYDQSVEAMADLESQLDVAVFEIPTPPVSVPGLRMRDAFERILRARHVRQLRHRHVVAARWTADTGFELEVAQAGAHARPAVEHVVRARAVILATGRFLGGGLASDRHRIREALFGLPVWQPSDRSQWHRPDMLDPRGHPLNLSGLETDELLRPVDAEGRCAYPTLFAAGSILAHQDWMRSKSGAGLAIATARGAVNALVHHGQL